MAAQRFGDWLPGEVALGVVTTGVVLGATVGVVVTGQKTQHQDEEKAGDAAQRQTEKTDNPLHVKARGNDSKGPCKSVKHQATRKQPKLSVQLLMFH